MNSSNSQQARPSLLLVDDDPPYLRLLVAMLAEFYEIQMATSGGEALRLLQQQPLPDLILLDIMMPAMDGYAVCREIKRQVSTQHIPVVFITALDEKTDEILGFEAGATDYIAKPFEPDVVLARVKNQLRHKFALDSLRDKVNGAGAGADDTSNVFRAMGSSWQIGFHGQPRFQLKDMLGLAYLQCLVAHPGRYFSVEDVVFLAVPKERERLLTCARSRIDDSSLNHYRQLTQKVIENRRQQAPHSGLSAITTTSVEQLLGELRRAGILASDVASAIDDRERYRKSVGNAIRRAIREISEYDLALASHLQFPTLRLGFELVYSPEMPVFWAV
jgi:CheY-like chemotaxis protein